MTSTGDAEHAPLLEAIETAILEMRQISKIIMQKEPGFSVTSESPSSRGKDSSRGKCSL